MGCETQRRELHNARIGTGAVKHCDERFTRNKEGNDVAAV